MKKVILIISLLMFGFVNKSMAQEIERILLNDAVNNTTISKCTYELADDRDSNNYSNNKDYSVTLCATSVIEDRLTIRFDSFDVHSSDTLWIHEGTSLSNPLIALDGATAFTGTMLQGKSILSPLTTTGCLTIRFKTNATGNAPGFLAKIECDPRCQTPVPVLDTFFLKYSPDGTVSERLVKHDIDVDSVFEERAIDSIPIYIPKYDTADKVITDPISGDTIYDTLYNPITESVFIRVDSIPYDAIDICEGDSVVLLAKVNFPENDMLYHQSDSTCVFYWSFGEPDEFGNLKTDTGYYYNRAGHKWNKAAGYNLSLSVRDTTNIGNIGGCPSRVPAGYRVRISQSPIKAISSLPDMCSGTTQNVLAGQSGSSSIMVDSIPHPSEAKKRFEQTTFIPDGPNCSDQATVYYEAAVNFDKFTDGATLMAGSCLTSICINMEHTFDGDIDIYAICPSNKMIKLRPVADPNGGKTGHDFGIADRVNDFTNPCTYPPNKPGTGWTYCFSETYPYGTRDSIYTASDTLYTYDSIRYDSNFVSPSWARYLILYNSSATTQYDSVLSVTYSKTLDNTEQTVTENSNFDGNGTKHTHYKTQTDSTLYMNITYDSVVGGSISTLNATIPLGIITNIYDSIVIGFTQILYGTTVPLTDGDIIDSTDVQNKLKYYRPLQSFDNFVGCPLNGQWKIRVEDSWGFDNGFIFWFDLELGNCPGAGTWNYTTVLDSVLWEGPFMSRLDAKTMQIVTPIDTGGYFQYQLHIVDNLGCVWDTSTFANIIERPRIDLGADKEVCEGETVVIDATHRNATDYLWNTGSTSPSISVTPAPNSPSVQTYYVSLKNNSGTLECSYNDSIKIIVKQPSLASFTSTPSPLEGCEPFEFKLLNQSSNYDTLEWKVGDFFSNDTNPTFTLPYGDYEVRLVTVSADGCRDTLILDSSSNGDYRIHVYSHPVPDFAWEPTNPYSSDPKAQMINLTQPDYSSNQYQWIYQNDKDNPNDVSVVWGKEPVLTWQPDQNGSSLVGDYNITLVAYTNSVGTHGNTYQCSDSIKRTITIVNHNLIFPNVITPNGDGVNDMFIIRNLIDGQAFPDNELTIYNRYGRLIYFKQDMRINEEGWDPNSTNTPDGTYFYRFVGRGPIKDVEYTGTIDILRK
ncbi:MAG: gliding motility-associated C-terminal domain-containing protein [Bacteroidales bacterium]|jgi:gliding motility-associated-like protein|nr:gliding motility-associated C-terminal domain-containing protein [Bacteroidales bacterium]